MYYAMSGTVISGESACQDEVHHAAARFFLAPEVMLLGPQDLRRIGAAMLVRLIYSAVDEQPSSPRRETQCSPAE